MDAALMSQFVYSDRGQLLTSTFMDHLLSSALEVPHMTMDDVCTPAPGHPLGAKGAGEGGYMTAPAAIISAIEDAVSDYGLHLTAIPITPDTLHALLKAAPHED
jgi:CO/xanthine dehydrogenase Mo-binding subunit